jgi:hypothetical protein
LAVRCGAGNTDRAIASRTASVGNGDNIEGPRTGAVSHGRPGQRSRAHQVSNSRPAVRSASATPTPGISVATGSVVRTAEVAGVGLMPLCNYDCGGNGFMTILVVAAVIVGRLAGIDVGAAAVAGTAEATAELAGVLSGLSRSDFVLAA